MENMALVLMTNDKSQVVPMEIMHWKSLNLQSQHPAGDFAFLSRVAGIKHKTAAFGEDNCKCSGM